MAMMSANKPGCYTRLKSRASTANFRNKTESEGRRSRAIVWQRTNYGDTQRITIREGAPFLVARPGMSKGTTCSFSAPCHEGRGCLFDDKGERDWIASNCRNVADRIWHGYLRTSGLAPFMDIGFTGPTSLDKATFQSDKLLLDPYACAHIGELKWDLPYSATKWSRAMI